MMEGRWTITRRISPFDGDLVTGPQLMNPPMPVVPCDDAAIERATKFATPFLRADLTALGARAVTEGILRAAGETP